MPLSGAPPLKLGHVVISFKCNSYNPKAFPSSSSSSKRDSLFPLKSKRRILDLGIGLLAASLVVSTPLDANATRVEYYATVGEPLCDLNFVKSGLGYCDVAVGSGAEALFGELINIHYTARFADGTVFDSSYKLAVPLTMQIGVGKVIKGLDQGIFGGGGVSPMVVGGKRKLRIPPELAFGPDQQDAFKVIATSLLLQLSSMILIWLDFTSEDRQNLQNLWL